MQGIVCFNLANRIYGIKIEEISEIVDELSITPLFKVPIFLEGVTNLRGKIIAVINFAKLVNLPGETKTEKRKLIIVQSKSEKEAAILVDNIKEVKWTNPEDFQEVPDTVDEAEKKYLINLIKTEEMPIPVIDVRKLLEDEMWQNIA
ncbi:MAG TPA: chemotaxis protein CheW [bacterium]|nr:chemotaxis protein CheW [bacterium]HOL48449.1 chemotaxis protein CheW [bacterium]HPQ19148.1 chemotaxis protein CheW [bacterium]